MAISWLKEKQEPVAEDTLNREWIPSFEFEALALGVDCKKFAASCYRMLAASCADNPEMARQLTEMAGAEEAEIKVLARRVNTLLEMKLSRFYENGGAVMTSEVPASVLVTIRPLVLNWLAVLEEHERTTSRILANRSYGDPMVFARDQKRFVNNWFRNLAAIYPEGDIKETFRILSED